MSHQSVFDEQVELIKKIKYGGEESPSLTRDIARLKDNEPIEYILGEAQFAGLRIDMSERPMPPREETAFWVKRAILSLPQNKELRIADLFAGAGNVGTLVLSELPLSTVEFHELDAKLLPGIERTLDLNHIDRERATVHASSVLDGLTGEYDAILAVPPYVAREALPELDPEMIKHEPHLAFFADENGRAFHRMLIEGARNHLKDGGVLFMETDMDHKEGTLKMLDTLPEGEKWSKVEFWPDPYGAEANVVLTK